MTDRHELSLWNEGLLLGYAAEDLELDNMYLSDSPHQLGVTTQEY